jgi:amidohydrolase
LKLLSGEELEDRVICLRRDFHRYPELSGEEKRTSQIVQDELRKLGVEYKAGIGGYGVLGIIEGVENGPTVGVRADMDALPIKERCTDEYVSAIDGQMHACGHDAHTAMLIGTAHYLMERKDQLKGKVLLVFQPSEEMSPIGGAKPMMEDGLFDKHTPDVLFAQHVWPKLPVGQFGIKHGNIMGASDKFQLTIRGEGGHASMPHHGVDAIIAANKVVDAIQTIVSRNVDPLKEVVISVGVFQAGSRHNVIADEAYLEGTIRCFDLVVREQVEKRMRELILYTCKSMGATHELNYHKGYPATFNDEDTGEFVKREISNWYGKESCPTILPSLGGEDFARFLEKYKGVYYWLGVGGDTGDYPILHNPHFNIDERALKIGYSTMGEIVLSYGWHFS